MSETKTLEIFKPLKSYFAILCQNDNCYNDSKCKELIDILSSKDCVPDKGISDNFKLALSWFAYELKQADSPVGIVTIKNKLKKIFDDEFNDINIDSFVNNVVSKVNSATDLSGFKMTDNNGENRTYEDILKDIIDLHKTRQEGAEVNNENIFQRWLDKSFEMYTLNKTYFADKVKPYLKKLDICELKLLTDYFDVVLPNNKLQVKDYISKMESDYKNIPARLNVKIMNELPKLLVLLPDLVKEAFEEYLVTPQTGSPVFYKTPKCYKLQISQDEPKKEEFKLSKPNKVLDWFKHEALGLRKRTAEPEIIDKDDVLPYVDSDEKTEYNFPGSFDVVNFQDNWRADLTGRLWKKNNSTGKFEEYTDSNLEADSKKFGDKNGHCGNLCIFSDSEKCSEFFERMMKGDELSIDELSKEITDGNFVRSYKELKKNIVDVNPLFVVGTLRMFGFDKYNQLEGDGTKTVRYENFTRWWNKYGDKLNLTKVEKNKFPGLHPGLTPEAPANLELFFKLLISFINGNKFVLNPQTKELINKSGKPKMSEYGGMKENFMINGKAVPNIYYEQEKAISEGRVPTSSEPESLSSLVELMRKNALFSSKPVNMGLPENRANLSMLIDLMIGITTEGKFRLSKGYPFSTGKGYILGGAEPTKKMLPCAENAHEIYKIGINALKNKKKSLRSDINTQLEKNLDDLDTLEKDVYDKLYILANYIKVINVMNDDAANSDVTMEIMNNAIKEYEDKSGKLSSKADSTISMLLKNLFDVKSSYYSK